MNIEEITNRVKAFSDSQLLEFLEIYSKRVLDYDDPTPLHNVDALGIIGLEMARRLTEKSGRLDIETVRAGDSE